MYCITTNGDVVKIDTGIKFPNGIAVLHEDDHPKLLIVAETPTKSLWCYDITGPAKVTNKRLWGTLPGNT